MASAYMCQAPIAGVSRTHAGIARLAMEPNTYEPERLDHIHTSADMICVLMKLHSHYSIFREAQKQFLDNLSPEQIVRLEGCTSPEELLRDISD